MSTPIAAAITAALIAVCIAATRMGPGIRAWSRADQANYAVMVLALWPLVVLGLFTTLPRWYTATAMTVTIASLVVFLIRQARDLRRSKAEFAQLEAEVGRMFPEPPGDHG